MHALETRALQHGTDPYRLELLNERLEMASFFVKTWLLMAFAQEKLRFQFDGLCLPLASCAHLC